MRGRRISWTVEQIKFCREKYAAGGMSTRDLAARFGVSFQSVATMLKGAGVELSASAHISRKRTGKPSPRKGATHTAEARQRMSASLSGRVSATLGKRYSEAERANIAAGLSAHYASLRAEGKLLTPEERRARASCRDRYKRLVRRLIANKAGQRTHELLGYSAEEFRRHIEAQFQPGMAWADRESFHVDHKEPVAAFLARGIVDPKVVCALANLQPLTPHQNRKKSSSQGVA